MKRIINCETGEVIERPFNEEELAQLAIDETNSQIAEAAKQAELQAKAQAKAALLAQLGITEEQAKLLLS